MTYSFRRALYITYLAFFKAKNTLARLTPKRIFVLLVFYTIYIVVELLTWLCFGLDEILYPSYRKQEIKEPLFIVIGGPLVYGISWLVFFIAMYLIGRESMPHVKALGIWAIVRFCRRYGSRDHSENSASGDSTNSASKSSTDSE